MQMQANIAGLIKLLEGVAELVFIDGTHVCTPEDDAKQYDSVKMFFPKKSCGDYREWFNAKDVSKGGTGPEYVEYAYKDEAIAHVAKTLATASPPFDGLMGFSQGGSLAAWIGALQAAGKLTPASPPLKFLWLQSARTPRDPSCEGLFNPPLTIPSFVSFNHDDPSVLADETRALIKRFANATVVERETGSHAMLNVIRAPADGQRLLQWMRQFGRS